jgi:hypothetical protein
LLYDSFIVTQNSQTSPDAQKPRHRNTDAN